MAAKVMLDSGAFSVWKSGKTVDLNAYIKFCKGNPAFDYYVNLDVIPKDGRVDSKDGSARQSSQNYKALSSELPTTKVLPVFHMGEDFRWLYRILDLGCKYIGLGDMVGAETRGRLVWLRETKKYVPADVKVHGFGLTSFDGMREFPWYSIDSTTWARHAQVWHVLVPKARGGRYDYSTEPLVIGLSPRGRKPENGHIDRLTPTVRTTVLDYLAEQRAAVGEYVAKDCLPGEKLAKGESWVTTARKQKVVPLIEGVKTSLSERLRLNGLFYRKAAASLGIADFYYSGLSDFPPWADEVSCVLLSYANLPKGYERWLAKK